MQKNDARKVCGQVASLGILWLMACVNLHYKDSLSLSRASQNVQEFHNKHRLRKEKNAVENLCTYLTGKSEYAIINTCYELAAQEPKETFVLSQLLTCYGPIEVLKAIRDYFGAQPYQTGWSQLSIKKYEHSVIRIHEFVEMLNYLFNMFEPNVFNEIPSPIDYEMESIYEYIERAWIRQVHTTRIPLRYDSAEKSWYRDPRLGPLGRPRGH
jgi:hypothetical protein